MTLSRRSTLLALGLAAGPAALRAQAQSARAIRLIVPFTPGGSTDILARALAPRLALALGQAVVIDNKPGVGGSLGAAEAARADADGHTLLMGHIGTLAVNPALYPESPYDPVKSFAPVAGVARVPNVLVVPAASPAPRQCAVGHGPDRRPGGRHFHRRTGRAAACAQRPAAGAGGGQCTAHCRAA